MLVRLTRRIFSLFKVIKSAYQGRKKNIEENKISQFSNSPQSVFCARHEERVSERKKWRRKYSARCIVEFFPHILHFVSPHNYIMLEMGKKVRRTVKRSMVGNSHPILLGVE